MQRYLGLDVQAASCALPVISQTEKLRTGALGKRIVKGDGGPGVPLTWKPDAGARRRGIEEGETWSF